MTIRTRGIIHCKSLLLLGLLAAVAVGPTTASAAVLEPTRDLRLSKGRPNDWRMAEYGINGSNHNPTEKKLRSDNVADLEVLWVLDAAAVGHFIGPIHATPVVANGRSYVGSFFGTFYAIDRDGQLLWEALTDPPSPELGAIIQTPSTPIIGSAALPMRHPLVIYGDLNGVVYARKRATGELVWSVNANPHPLGGLVGNALLVVGDTLFVGLSSNEHLSIVGGVPCCSHRGGVVAMEIATGKELWRYETISPAEQGPLPAEFAPETFGPSGADVWGQPTYDPETYTIYIGTGQNFSRNADGDTSTSSDAVIAVDALTGTELWRTQVRSGDIWRQELPNFDPVTGVLLDQDIGDSPTVYRLANGRKVVGAGQKSGHYNVFDAHTGEVVARTKHLQQANQLGGLQTGGALLGDTVFQHGLADEPADSPYDFVGTVIAMSLDGTEVKWRREFPSSGIAGGIATVNDFILFQSPVEEAIDSAPQWGLLALDADTGETLARHLFDGRALASPAISNGRVYVGTGNLLFPEFFGGTTVSGSVICLGLPGDDDED